MESQSNSGSKRTNARFFTGAAILLMLAAVVLLFALVNPSSTNSGLLPILATPSPVQDNGDSPAPIPVTFSELNSEPQAYLNLPIQVSGGFMRVDQPVCARYSGPVIKWALVAEELQLDVRGFERIVNILAPDTEMTVQGIWRLYQGPLGCGKGPAVGSAWYLQAQRILRPNPLVGGGSTRPIDIQSGLPGLPELLPTLVPTSTTIPTATQVTATTEPTATQDQFAPTITLEASSTPSLVETPLFTPSAATNTPQPGAGTAVPSATPDSTPEATATGSSGAGDATPSSTPSSPTLATATQTSGGGYPGPSTATPTASPDPYP